MAHYQGFILLREESNPNLTYTTIVDYLKFSHAEPERWTNKHGMHFLSFKLNDRNSSNIVGFKARYSRNG